MYIYENREQAQEEIDHFENHLWAAIPYYLTDGSVDVLLSGCYPPESFWKELRSYLDWSGESFTADAGEV